MTDQPEKTAPTEPGESSEKKPGRRRSRPRRKKPAATTAAQTGAGGDNRQETETEQPTAAAPDQPDAAAPEQGATEAVAEKKSRSRRPRRRGRKSGAKEPVAAETAQEEKEPGESRKKTPPAVAAEKADTGKTEKKPAAEPPSPSLRLLINTEEPEECRIALLENNRVEAFYVETVSRQKTKGNIYKGKIVSIEPNLQAVFIDIGLEKNAFLPFAEIHPEYYCKEVDEGTHWKDLKISEVLCRGQEVLVEVIKEAAGNKGASTTTYLSLPGRYLVLMPGSESQGISRKLSDAERDALRELIKGLKLPEGIGYIVRTASKNVTKTALAKDLRYLLNLWDTIRTRAQEQPTPSLLFREQNIVARFLRDHYTDDTGEIVVDSQEAFDQVQTFLDLLPAAQKKTRVRLHNGSRPLFDHFGVEKQIEQIFQPQVKLPSGGSIVISPTEALVAIDVNSGSTSKDKDFEESIFLANMEAAEELARQLRLRDLGGLIVVDFIDMRAAKHTREVEKKLRESMKRDKAKFDLGRISKFGLMQISRQRLGPPVHTEGYRVCAHCEGRGVVATVETQVLAHLRKIQGGVLRRNIKRIVCDFPVEIAQYILNKKRADLHELETKYNVEIVVTANPAKHPGQGSIDFQQ